MDITYDYYRIFYHVARYGSVSRAAKVLMRGQPNITKAMQNLEGQLRCKLFVRSNRGIMLTSEGEKLYSHLSVAFEHISAAEEEIYSAVNSDSGTISVATTEVALYGSILPALVPFSVDYPKVKVKLTNANNSSALNMLKSGLADVAVLSMNDKFDSSLRVKTVKNFRELLCIKKGYLSADENGIDVIKNHTYISSNSSTYGYEFCKDYLVSQGLLKEPDILVATSNQVLQLVKSGVGAGFVSEPIVSEYIKNGIIEEIILAPSPPIREICLVEDKNRPMSAVSRKFVEYLWNFGS